MNSLHQRAIVIEDDAQINDYICFLLQREGLATAAFASGLDAMDALDRNEADIVLLDLRLPDTDGIDLIKQIRDKFDLPVIVVSAREQINEKVVALDLGADDYLTKPFSGAELTARVRVALRHRRTRHPASDPQIVSVDALSIDLEKHLVLLRGAILHLTPMEYDLLALFFMNIGKVLTTGYILKEIWGTAYGDDTQALRTMMAGLRRKVEQNPAKPRYILTETGVGYRLSDF